MKKIGIIGFGNMGSALAAGIVQHRDVYAVQISEMIPEKIKLAEEHYKIKNQENKAELINSSDIIIIAVKPQELDKLFTEIKGVTRNKQIITLCAGRTIALFSSKLDTPFVTRFMPNLAAMEAQSAVGVAFGEKVSPAFKEDCLHIARAIGYPFELPENLIPAITGLSGSGIAFVFAYIHAMALGGVAAGIAYPKSLDITIKTIRGALAVLEKHPVNPIEMLSRVISPAGTTIKGVEALEKGNFTSTVMEAVSRAAERAAELEG